MKTGHIVLDSDFDTYAMADIDKHWFVLRLWNDEDAFFEQITVHDVHTGLSWGVKIKALTNTYLCRRIPELPNQLPEELSVSEQAEILRAWLVECGVLQTSA